MPLLALPGPRSDDGEFLCLKEENEKLHSTANQGLCANQGLYFPPELMDMVILSPRSIGSEHVQKWRCGVLLAVQHRLRRRGVRLCACLGWMVCPQVGG